MTLRRNTWCLVGRSASASSSPWWASYNEVNMKFLRGAALLLVGFASVVGAQQPPAVPRPFPARSTRRPSPAAQLAAAGDAGTVSARRGAARSQRDQRGLVYPAELSTPMVAMASATSTDQRVYANIVTYYKNLLKKRARVSTPPMQQLISAGSRKTQWRIRPVLSSRTTRGTARRYSRFQGRPKALQDDHSDRSATAAR
jgi:hypothetical protein